MAWGKRWTVLRGRPDPEGGRPQRSGRPPAFAVPEVLSADALARLDAHGPAGCGTPLGRLSPAAPAVPGDNAAPGPVADAGEAVRLAVGGGPSGAVRLQIPAGLPPVAADGTRLRLAVAALVEHALRRRPPGTKVLVGVVAVSGAEDGGAGRVEIRVVDRGVSGPGEAKYWTVVERAQRAALAAGARLRVEDTPAGGLTLVLELGTVGDRDSRHRG
ncbi:hypothetical protein [Kitasatospora sp. NPDC057015]|uniref:hypothetical protein n=1 Tax=Kitasatospora sp. NPDC057015 TaxID=3346001 RepID=UPI00362D8B88